MLAAEKKSGGRQKELALPKSDFHGRTSFCTGGETDRRTALPRMRIAFPSCTCRGGRGQDNGKRCEGCGTADAPVGRRGEKKIRREAEAYQAKELAAAKESADKAMTVLSELKRICLQHTETRLLWKKKSKIWKPVFHPLKNHWSRRKKSEKRGDYLSGAERAERTLRKTGGRIFKSVGREKPHPENKSGGSRIY